MKNLKKLNRKGFTLIELLAVIVILAVIMVIAGTSVIGSMNTSRKKSLVTSAQSAKDAFDMAYGDYLVTGSTTGFMGYDDTAISDLLGGTPQAMTDTVATKLDINGNDYDLAKSYVSYDTTNSTFAVCMVAKEGGSFYLADAKSTANKTVKNITLASGTMWACSDGTTSW